MTTLATLEAADCEPLVGEGFVMDVDGTCRLDVRLIEVTRLGERDPGQAGRAEPFSLLFRGPADAVAAQGTYAVAHARLGTLRIFLVPIGPDEQGMRYEAVFN